MKKTIIAITSLIAWVYLFMTHVAIASALLFILWDGNIQVTEKINNTLKALFKTK